MVSDTSVSVSIRSTLTQCRLQEETAKVEEHLLDNRHERPSFTDAIVRCVTISKANAFENLLEPLQKLLRLSPPIASTLARPDLFTRLGQKLHHNKAAVRLNLLRIISSICDSSEEQGDLLARYGLLDAIRELENDPAILVRDMAGKLVRSSEKSDSMGAPKRRPPTRRRSGSNSSPSLISSHSTPSSPQVSRSSQSRGYLDPRETPRHTRSGLNGSAGLRPTSRDGSSPVFAHGGSGGPAAARNRLPRAMSSMSNRVPQVGSLNTDEYRAPEPSTRRLSIVNLNGRRRRANVDSEWT